MENDEGAAQDEGNGEKLLKDLADVESAALIETATGNCEKPSEIVENDLQAKELSTNGCDSNDVKLAEDECTSETKSNEAISEEPIVDAIAPIEDDSEGKSANDSAMDTTAEQEIQHAGAVNEANDDDDENDLPRATDDDLSEINRSLKVLGASQFEQENNEKDLLNAGNGSVDVPTFNGESMSENADTVDSDINFDKIFDGLPENRKTDYENMLTNDLQPIAVEPNVKEVVSVAKTAIEIPEPEKPIELDKLSNGEEFNSSIQESAKQDEAPEIHDLTATSGDEKTLNNSDIGPDDEDLLLKSPSMDDKFDNKPDYTESMLLKDESKASNEVIDDDDDEDDDVVAIMDSSDDIEPMTTQTDEKETPEPVSQSIEPEKSEPKTVELLNESQPTETDNQADSLCDQLKRFDASETTPNQCDDQNDDKVVINEEKSTNETDDIELSNQDDIEKANLEPIAKSPSESASIQLPEKQSDEIIENLENKENNLLEEMSTSPMSVDQCLEGSMSSVRDDLGATETEFAEKVVDLKDDNSTDARDGFSESKSNSTADLHADDVSHSSIDKNDSSDVVEMSASIGNFDSILDLQDLIESKSETGNEIAVDTPDKSNESVIAIDDDDVIFDSSTPQAAKDSADNTVADVEQPPSKRMRMDETQNESESVATKPDVDVAKPLCLEEENESADPTDNQTKQPDDDDDDILIIETPETKPTDSVANSNKRPASPLDAAIDEGIRKKHKPDTATEEPVSTEPSTVDNVEVKDSTEPEPEVTIEPVAKTEVKEEADIVKSGSVKVQEPVEKAIDTKDDMKVELTPKPEMADKRSIALDFAAKFKKGLNQMSRKNLEELVLEKIIEAIVHKSEYSELKQKSDAQEQMIQASRVKLQEIGKQYRDLEIIFSRLKKDLENRNQSLVTPLKITRAVGLQVCVNKALMTKELAKVTAPQRHATVRSPAQVTRSVVHAAPPTVTHAQLSTLVHHQKPIPVPGQRQVQQIQARMPVRQAIRQITPEQARVTTTTGKFTSFSLFEVATPN